MKKAALATKYKFNIWRNVAKITTYRLSIATTEKILWPLGDDKKPLLSLIF